MLPYQIPIIRHSLLYALNYQGLFQYVEHMHTLSDLVIALKHPHREQFPDCKPYSLMLFGKWVFICCYLFRYHHGWLMDVAGFHTCQFYQSKVLPFLPLMESLSGLAWDILPDSMKHLTAVDSIGNCLFHNMHLFYHHMLKPGSQLDVFMVKFLHCLQQALDTFKAKHSCWRHS